MIRESCRELTIYVGLSLCVILLVFSVFSLAFFTSLTIKAQELTKTQPTGFEQALKQLFYGISAYLYFPNIFLQIQFALLSVILAIVIVSFNKEHLTMRGVVTSIGIGIVIGISAVHYLMSALSLKP